MNNRHLALAIVGIASLLALTACSDDGDSTPTATAGGATTVVAPTRTAPETQAAPTSAPSSLTLTSDAFTNNTDIPVKYSCSGDATSPALTWTGAPSATKSFTLVVHDPDAPLAGGFTHWIVIDLPGTVISLPAAVPAGKAIAAGGAQLVDYRGMCPPVGAAAHHYHFRLYALDAMLGAAAGQTKDSVEAAMQGHILAQTDLVGLFAR